MLVWIGIPTVVHALATGGFGTVAVNLVPPAIVAVLVVRRRLGR
jgi:hypothetical protein